jgi:hypothetical protein
MLLPGLGLACSEKGEEMIEVGKSEVIREYRQQGWSVKIIALLVHSNRYGWVTRLDGWTGPVENRFDTRESAISYLNEWVAQAPNVRCGFISK